MFGIRISPYEEVICAWVILKAVAMTTAEELKSFCLTNFAESKAPKFIKFVDNFNIQSAIGKTQWTKLAEVYKLERKHWTLESPELTIKLN